MAGVPVSGNSYIEIGDADGVSRDLSAFVEEVEPLGWLVSYVDVTGLNDESSRVAEGNTASQEFTLRGLFDDTPDTGSDAVLGGIVGREVTVSYGPVGRATGERRITGRFLCTGYQVGGRLEKGKAVGLVRFVARFRQSGPVTLDRWE
ncbi:MAG: hypothetical protein F4X65_07130 [Chloroflexi bacterium]|nr:hypothetical protein [Chloroflexota bacterium]